MARIVLNTFGSLGDVHPYIAIALELQRRGHCCVLATAEIYRRKVVAEGLEFAPVSPDVGELLTQPELIRKLWHPTKGPVYLMRDYLLPAVEQSYQDLNDACEGADFLLTHAAPHAGPIVAAVRKLPWLSVALQPAIYFSSYDPAVLAIAPWTRHIFRLDRWRLGRWLFLPVLAAAKLETRRWAKPVFKLRARLGVANDSNPVIGGPFSPLGTLTLFSSHFAQQQPDWPPNSSPTGFIFYDKRGEGFGLDAEPASGMSEPLRKFLTQGPPPILFTLGSAAVTHPENFYSESAAAARKLGKRAVMLVGRQVNIGAHIEQDKLIHLEEYASYSKLMPLVSAVVHQGGIGTTANTLRAGKPMIIVPWSHDQPDNGYRIQRMGLGRVLPRNRYCAERAATELKTIMENHSFAEKAANMADLIRQEDGLNKACDRIEAALRERF